jgi:hypothetical protein
MKITLEFGPDEQAEANRAIHAGAAWSLLWEMDQELRSLLKHGAKKFNKPEDLAAHLREQILDVLAKIDE